MKLLEAMAMEKVVLVSDVAAMTEVVRHRGNGLVFRKGDRPAFLDVLELITVEWDRLSELGRRARQDVIATYSWRTSREKLQRVYDELVGRTT
jgi:glycosyltransferase involved in cell wall biosynthesis